MNLFFWKLFSLIKLRLINNKLVDMESLPEPTNAAAGNESASIEEENEQEHAVPDVELLQFQKQRSTPKVRLSNVNEEGIEEQLLAVDNFEQLAEKGEDHYGMMQAGGEQKIIKQLIKQGSLDANGMPVKLEEPGKLEEEKKE